MEDFVDKLRPNKYSNILKKKQVPVTYLFDLKLFLLYVSILLSIRNICIQGVSRLLIFFKYCTKSFYNIVIYLILLIRSYTYCFICKPFVMVHGRRLVAIFLVCIIIMFVLLVLQVTDHRDSKKV